MTRHLDVAERRARLAVRHLLAPGVRADGPVGVAEALVALHGSDPASVYLSVGARTEGVYADAVERALYDDRALMRLHGMRRTVFVVPTELVPVIQASTTEAVAARERRAMVKFITEQSFDHKRLSQVEDDVLAALATAGTATGGELGDAVPALREQFVYGAGKSYEATQTLGMRLLTILGMEGRIVRGRPRGSWTSGQFRWSVGVDAPPLVKEHAKEDLVRRWLAAYGPGTEADLKWWTGWTVGDVRKSLAGIGAQQVTVDEGPAYVLAGDDEPVATPDPWVAFLPSLDPTPMGWQGRDWYIDEDDRAALFDRSGNIGATVWWCGKVVGVWTQRADGEIAVRVLRDVGRDAETAIEEKSAKVARWLGDVRVTPRFRTVLERTLAG